MSLRKCMDEVLYPGASDNWDDDILRRQILKHIGATPRPLRLLDVGAGAGIVKQMNFRGICESVCGIDLDSRVLNNALLDEGRVGAAESIPYEDSRFDLVFADNVLEHLPDPQAAFQEIYRVLKDDGVFLFKTPNVWHYMPAVARLTPLRFHKYVNRWRGRAPQDTFPTLYMANSLRVVRHLAASSGFLVESVSTYEGRPQYLRMTAATYLLGAAYERLVNSSSRLQNFRIVMVGQFRKRTTTADEHTDANAPTGIRR